MPDARRFSGVGDGNPLAGLGLQPSLERCRHGEHGIHARRSPLKGTCVVEAPMYELCSGFCQTHRRL